MPPGRLDDFELIPPDYGLPPIPAHQLHAALVQVHTELLRVRKQAQADADAARQEGQAAAAAAQQETLRWKQEALMWKRRALAGQVSVLSDVAGALTLPAASEGALSKAAPVLSVGDAAPASSGGARSRRVRDFLLYWACRLFGSD